jgi:hypothetical protein
LVLSRSTVSRGLILLEPDAAGELCTVPVRAQIALARCCRCGARPRVLPYDVLPYKRYSLAVMSEEMATYTKGGSSLRDVAWNLLGERTPCHATLHGWTEGLGAHALGLPSGELGAMPFSRFLAEAQARTPSLRACFEAHYEVDPRRYRSEPRRERLAAVAMVMALGRELSECPAAQRLAQCRCLTLAWSGSCVLVFPSRLLCTAIEHRSGVVARTSHGGPQMSRPRCPIRTRSPPGASSRSRR